MKRLVLVFVFVLAAAESAATEVLFRHRPEGPVRTVSVAGEFNEWNVNATPLSDDDGDGVWEVKLDLAPGRHAYKFVEDGGTWITDMRAEAFTGDGFGGQNSVLELGDETRVVGEPLTDAEVIEYVGPEVHFQFVPGRQVNAVSVAGDFNDWNAAALPLRDDDGDGVWEGRTRIPAGDHLYQFVIDGDAWVGAPGATEHVEDGFGGRSGRLSVGEVDLVIRGE